VPRRLNTAEAIGAFLATRRAANARPATITWYTQMLRPLATAHDTIPDKANALETLLADSPGGPVTRLDRWRALRILYGFLATRYAAPNAMAQVSRPRTPRQLPRYLTEAQVDQLLWTNQRHPRDRALLLLLLDTGARIGEIAGLTRGNIIAPTATDPARIQVDGKSGQAELTIDPETHLALARLPWHSDHPATLWTSLTTGEPLTANGLQQAVKRAFARAGLKAGGPHKLRHTFAVSFMRDGGNQFQLQRILRHSSLATTAVYAELGDRDTQEAHRQHSPIARRFTIVVPAQAEKEA